MIWRERSTTKSVDGVYAPDSAAAESGGVRLKL
jgi:hypothetical protein